MKIMSQIALPRAPRPIRQPFPRDTPRGRSRGGSHSALARLWRLAWEGALRQPILSVSRIALLVISVGMAVASGEEGRMAAGTLTFHIPSQRLIDALQIYSQQAGVQ